MRKFETWQFVLLAAGGALLVEHLVAPKGTSIASKFLGPKTPPLPLIPPPIPNVLPAAPGKTMAGWDLFHDVFGVKDPFHGRHQEARWEHHREHELHPHGEHMHHRPEEQVHCSGRDAAGWGPMATGADIEAAGWGHGEMPVPYDRGFGPPWNPSPFPWWE